MSTLKIQISEAIKNSMKEKNNGSVVAYRSIMSEIIKAEKNNNNQEVSNDEIIRLIETMSKQRKEAILLYEKGNRQDLVDIEKFELDILNKFIPQKMDENATIQAIQKAISNGANNIGLLMKDLTQYGNLIDKKLASQLAKEYIK